MTDRDITEFHAAIARQNAANANANAVYNALKKNAGKLADQRLIAYRCQARGCLLLDVVQVPDQVIIHQPRYKRSPDRNATTSNESGRAKNTEDGDRRWKAQTYDPGSAINFVLNCDHLDSVVISEQRVQKDLDAGKRRSVPITVKDHEAPPAAGSAVWS